MQSCDLLDLVVFEQGIALGFEFQKILNFCEGFSRELDILLGKFTSSSVYFDCRFFLGFSLDFQDGSLRLKFDVVSSLLSLVNSPECLIQHHLLFGYLSFNDCSFVGIWQIDLQ